MNFPMKKYLLLFLYIFGWLPWLMAQDNHYESTQLGSQNAVLSGASLSRWVDQTAVINNPATMIFTSGPGLTFSTASAGFEKIKFTDGLGEGKDIESNTTIIYPGLLAGEIPFLKQEGNRTVGFSIYNRNINRLRFTNRITEEANIIDDSDSPGTETYVGLYSLDSDVSESAAAVGWAQRLSTHWSFGLTTQVFFRNQKYREKYSSTAITHPESEPSVDVVGAKSDISLQYSATLIQFKAGLNWQKADWSAGLVVTGPSVRIYSSGDMLAEITLDNVRVNGIGERRSFFANAFLNKLNPRYKYPFSVGGGLSKKIDKVHLSVAATWYASLKRYVIMDPGSSPFLQPPSDINLLYTPRFLEVWASNRSVVNTSVSGVWSVNDRTNLLFGFRTDQHFAEFADPVPYGFQLSKKIWNRYHISAGAEINWRRSYWIAGIQYSRGQADDYRQPHSFDGVTEGNFLQGESGRGEIRQNGLTLLLSYFLQIQRKGEGG